MITESTPIKHSHHSSEGSDSNPVGPLSSQELLRLVVEGTARATGPDFFGSLVRHLAAALGFRYVVVSRLDSTGSYALTEALWVGDSMQSPVKYLIAGSPCENVLQPSVCFYSDRIQKKFPEDRLLVEMEARSYLGVPLVSSSGAVLGVLAALDDRPMPERLDICSIMEIFAARAAAEFERIIVENELSNALIQKQEESEMNLAAVLNHTPFLARNVTKFRETEKELRKAKEIAQAADRSKSEFLATMSHELRTPLNSIMGFSGVLLQSLVGPINQEQQKQLGLIQSSSRHLLRLINNILDISRIEAGEVELHCETFNVQAAVEGTLNLLAPIATEKGLQLESEIGADDFNITTDRGRFEQILINLVGNAIKFTEEGGIGLQCKREGDQIIIRIYDTGIGIRKEDLARIFQPFRQIDPGKDRIHEGSGLGLAISQRLVILLGGELRVESEWNRGSTFTIVLSAESAPAAQDIFGK